MNMMEEQEAEQFYNLLGDCCTDVYVCEMDG